MPVKVPEKVLEGIEFIQRSGLINMLDRPGVQSIANDLEYHALVIWIEDNKSDYANGIFHGFEAEGE